jgi:hypothetical protein
MVVPGYMATGGIASPVQRVRRLLQTSVQSSSNAVQRGSMGSERFTELRLRAN